jgi:hypothetical protein
MAFAFGLCEVRWKVRPSGQFEERPTLNGQSLLLSERSAAGAGRETTYRVASEMKCLSAKPIVILMETAPKHLTGRNTHCGLAGLSNIVDH